MKRALSRATIYLSSKRTDNSDRGNDKSDGRQ